MPCADGPGMSVELWSRRCRHCSVTTGHRRCDDVPPCPVSRQKQRKVTAADVPPCPVSQQKQRKVTTADVQPCPVSQQKQRKVTAADVQPCPVSQQKQRKVTTADVQPCPVSQQKQRKVTTADVQPCPVSQQKQRKVTTTLYNYNYNTLQHSKVRHVLTRYQTLLPATSHMSLYSQAAEHHRTLASTHFSST